MVRHLYYDQLIALADVGGYSITTRLSELTGVFLLSACLVLQEKWLWQTPLLPISDSEYQNILSMIEQAEYELMTSFAIGQIIPSIADLSSDENLLMMNGQTISGLDYVDLFNVVPNSWKSGIDITLPDMSQTGVFGENGDIGDIIGENSVQLQISEMPQHTHIQDGHQHSEIIPVVTASAGGEIPATASIVVASPSSTGVTIATNQSTGGDGSHNNIQKSLAVYWFIVAR